MYDNSLTEKQLRLRKCIKFDFPSKLFSSTSQDVLGQTQQRIQELRISLVDADVVVVVRTNESVLVVLHHWVGDGLLGPGVLGECGHEERIVENPISDGINDLEVK